jgi:hypothetical protein
MTEPTLEELSAYLDHELDDPAQSRVAEHVAGCGNCQARLDGLRQTAYAIRALPMVTPPRRFTVPEAPARRQAGWRWAPVGWIGSLAVAMLVIVIGVTHINLGGPAANSASSGSGAGTAYLAQQPQRSTPQGAGAAAPQAGKTALGLDEARVEAPSGAYRILVTSDAQTYRPSGTMTVEIYYYGFNPSQVPPAQLFLERNGYAIQLFPPPANGTEQAGGVQGQYGLAGLPLPNPPAGSYTLTVIQMLPGNSGATLVAHLPITISG